jgi:hypothetical protein
MLRGTPYTLTGVKRVESSIRFIDPVACRTCSFLDASPLPFFECFHPYTEM